ncbi:MAG: hypothetical protein OHK0021_16370 [Bryobacter sp.]
MRNKLLRALAIFGGALVLAAGAIYAIGASQPATHTANVSIEIARPVEEVFPLVADPKRTKEWWPDMGDVQILSENPLRYRVSASGATSDMEHSLVEPNRRVLSKTLTPMMGIDGVWDTRFSVIPSGARIDHQAQMTFHSPFLRFFTLVMDMNAEERKTLEALKKYAESH